MSAPAKQRARTDPQLREMPACKMAVVEVNGDPNVELPKTMPALYGAVYPLKFARKKEGRDFTVGPLRGRWDWDGDAGDTHILRGRVGLPVPDDVVSVTQKDPAVPVVVETWAYGLVAEVLHRGPYAAEPATVARLQEFIAAQGLTVVPAPLAHEEEYLTRPDAKDPKTMIRYRVEAGK